MAVKVGGAVMPPHGPSLSQRSLGLINRGMCPAFPSSIALRSRGFDGPTRRHEIGHKFDFSCFRQLRVSEPPKSPANDEISSVRRDRML